MFTHKPWQLPNLIVQNDDTGRWYLLGDEKYKSVTTYIQERWDSRFLDEWHLKVGQEKAAHISKTSSDRGTALHKGIELYLNNEELPKYENPHYQMLFNKIKPHLNRIDNIRVLEKPLCSVVHKIAGRPDCIADYDRVQSVIDFKTSGKVKAKKYILNYFLQCGFYGLMAGEFYGKTADHDIKNAVIVMATEDSPTAQIFKENMDICIKMCESFIVDPVKFQEKWKKVQKEISVAFL